MNPRVFGCTRLCAVEYGKVDNTGRTEITVALQRAIDALPDKGGTIHLPPGSYLRDPTKELRLRNNLQFDMDANANVLVNPNDAIRYGVFPIRGVTNVQFIGGRIHGDRDMHNYVTAGLTIKQQTHEWCHAFPIYGSSQVSIIGTIIDNMPGDAVSISAQNVDGVQGDEPCDDIVVSGVLTTRNRRQGVSIGKATNVTVTGCDISYINGTSPECGIDIEPESGGMSRNILIELNHIHHCAKYGINLLHRSDVDSLVGSIVIRKNNIEYNGKGIEATNVNGLSVLGNSIQHNNTTGFAIMGGCTNVSYSENTFGQNYKHAARVPALLNRVGWTKALESDVLVRNTAVNSAGANNYL